jgi:hypothetical protein
MFAGPSPGTRARRHGRRHPSSPAMLRHCPSSTSPTIVISNSCRPCSTYPSPPKTSPPARTPRTDRRPPSRAVKGPSAISFLILRAFVHQPEDRFTSLLFSVSCQLVKLIGNCRNLQKLSNQFFWKIEVKLYNFG